MSANTSHHADMDLNNLSSNWKKLQSNIATEKTPANTKITTDTSTVLKRKRSLAVPSSHPPPRKKTKQLARPPHKPRRHGMDPPTSADLTSDAPPPPPPSHPAPAAVNAGLSPTVEIGKYIALDCEMVGVGPHGHESALARVSIVNYNTQQIYDSYVRPKEPVTDWRTPVSGIRPAHMAAARSFEHVQADVARILKDRVVVGHALRHDFAALLLDHPVRDVRDTSRLRAYRKVAGGTPKLSLLASELLGVEIQAGEHSSLEDARACMLLFRRDKEAFEVKSMGQRGRGSRR